MRSHEEDVAEEIIEAFLRALWSFRLELTLVAVGAGLWLLITHSIGETEAWIAEAVAAAVALAVPSFRRFIGRRLRHSRV